jgi:hypothetical protein
MQQKNQGEQELGSMREFKVHVPLRMHLRLHQHRLLTGTSLSASMGQALDAYFETRLPADVATA